MPPRSPFKDKYNFLMNYETASLNICFNSDVFLKRKFFWKLNSYYDGTKYVVVVKKLRAKF